MKITNDIKYVGVNDHQVDLFEGQYVVPNGMAYNSYVVLDEKIAVMDTVEIHFTREWLDNVETALDGRTPDYLVVQHMEPDHSANIQNFMKKYPDTTIVGNAKTFAMMDQFFTLDSQVKRLTVQDKGTLSLGRHELTFLFAPMVHWPEVMVTYDSTDKVLFSADGFGKFGALDVEEDWDDEARRYYIGIVSTQGAQAVKGLHLFQYSAYEVKYWVDLTFKSLGMLVTGQASIKDLGGPIAIAQTVGETYEATAPSGFVTVLLNMMNLVVLLSVNLGILNLLPLPALDGGRLLFMLIEVVRGKPVPPEKEGLVHFIGMAALLVLMVVVMYNDIMRLITS